MNGELFHLALQGIRRRRKTSLLLFLVLCFSFAFAVVSLSVTSSMEATNRNFRLVTYGRWQGAIVDGISEDKQFLEQQEWLSEMGGSHQAGTLMGEKGAVNFGTVDEAFISLGNLGLQDGRWPEANNEIVMEANSLSALKYDYELGQEITVKVGLPAENAPGGSVTVEHTFTLCGVIKAYTGLWQFSQFQQAQQFLNNALVTEGTVELLRQEGELEAQKLEEQAQEMIDQLKAEGEEVTDDLLSQTSITLSAPALVYIFTVKDGMDGEMSEAVSAYLDAGEETRTGLSRNEGAYGPADDQEESFQYFYAVLVFAVMIFAILCIYALQLPKQVRQIALFRSIGIKKSQLRRLALYESLILCLPALVLGAGVGALGTLGALRLLFYSGSAPLAVALPWALLGILAAVWVLGVFLSRLVILQIALREPLTGRIAMSSKKAKRIKRAQTTLITVLASLLCGVTVFTAMQSLKPLSWIESSKDWASYAIYGGGLGSVFTDMGSGEIPSLVSPSWKKLAETVPGIKGGEAETTFTATLTFDGMEDSDYYQGAIEAKENSNKWSPNIFFYSSDTLGVEVCAYSEEKLKECVDLKALGIDEEDFRQGKEVIVVLQTDVDGSYCLGMPLVQGSYQTQASVAEERRHYKDPGLKTGDTVSLSIYGSPWPPQNYDVKDNTDLYQFSARAVVVKDGYSNSKTGVIYPYGVVCSYEFMEKAYGEMGPGFDSFNTVTGSKFGYTNLFLGTSQDAGYLATDAVIASMCQEEGFWLQNSREQNAAIIQEHTQTLILLFGGGGCVLLILLLILGNTFSLEREREKRAYGVLQALGLSKKQMRRKVLKTALFRGTIGAAIGWLLFGGFLLADAPRVLAEETAWANQANAIPKFTTIWGALTETIHYFQVDGANLWLVLGLTLAVILVIAGLSLLCKRRLFQDDLMEKLRDEQ